MFKADHSSHEVKHEAEVNNIAILKELKLFFMSNKHQGSKSQDCERYNSVLEVHKTILVYIEDENVHKLFVNDEPLEPQDAIEMLAQMIESLQTLNVQNVGETPDASSSTSFGNTDIKAHAERDVIMTGSVSVTTGGSLRIGGGDTIINNPVYVNHTPILDGSALNSKEAQALTQLKNGYSASEYATIPGIFGSPLKLEGQYINLQMLCVDLRNKKTEEDKESKDLTEEKHEYEENKLKREEKYKDARMASVEDLFGDKRAIKAENLFKPTRELFDNQVLETVKDANEAPRLLLVQGRAGIGKTAS